MISLIDSSPLSRTHISSENTAPTIESTSRQNTETKTLTNTHGGATITSLASQLSDAALRAKTTYANYTKQQLENMRANTSQLLAGDTYNNNKLTHNAETPNTQDPTLLERAQQATYYVNKLGKNPFSGMPRDQLELIIYDDSGNFTINERRAALFESSNQESAWRKRVVDDYFFNKDVPGKAAEFQKNILDHYRGLPLVARSEAPDDYEAILEKRIEQELNIATTTSEKTKKPNKNLSPEIAQRILERDISLLKTILSVEQQKRGDAPTLARPEPSEP